ncbi:hypothetical protein KKE60_06900 [Patescibacteria group bacterium]|nr:hypothetical protein [Patescibacteria group bacterium]
MTNPAITYTTATANEQQARRRKLAVGWARQQAIYTLADNLYNKANLLRTCSGRSWGFYLAEVRGCVEFLRGITRVLEEVSKMTDEQFLAWLKKENPDVEIVPTTEGYEIHTEDDGALRLEGSKDAAEE